MQRVCKVVGREQLRKDIWSITVDGGEIAAKAKPGQFVHVKCGDGVLLRRPISICDVREEKLTIVFHVKGAGTKWLAEAAATELDVLGPLGYGFEVTGENILFVGGGIGVPPLLYAARQAGGKKSAILGFASSEQVILTKEFEVICDEVSYTTNDGSFGEAGFVTAPLERALQTGAYDAVLTCGPTPMLRAVAEVAARFDVECQVSLEERMACGVGACVGCAVEMTNDTMLRVCKDGPVFRAKEVKWNV